MIKEDGSTPVSFPLVTLKWTIWGGQGYSCQTMNFVLLMLLDVNRVNAEAYPELQIRGGGGGEGWRGRGGAGGGRGRGGGPLPWIRRWNVFLPFHAWFSEVYCCCRCCLFVQFFVVVVVVFFPNLRQKVKHSFWIFGSS